MKKTFLLCLTSLFVLGAQAQKKAKSQKFDPSTMIKNQTDSLSYALGQNMTNGLKEHLVTLEVLKDTAEAKLIEGFAQKMEEANEKGKEKLKKELASKRSDVVKENNANLKFFLDGVESALTEKDKKSYNAGIGVGTQLDAISKRFQDEMLKGSELNKDAFVYSIMSAMNGEKSVIENSEGYLQKVGMEIQQAEEITKAEELQALHGERISSGVKFLADNKTKEGIKTLDSGLQYKVIKEGTGTKPVSSDRVTVHYEGRLLDGTVFDSSYKRNEPTTFGVTQVIKGWTEALQLMPAGSKWTIYVPHDLAYGERDSGAIPPFSTLIFDIELIEIAK